MKLKRVLISVMAGAEALLLIIGVAAMARYAIESSYLPTKEISYYFDMMSYANHIIEPLRAICLLVLVDFVFCIATKSFNKSMFGIAIAEFALTVVMLFMASPFVGLNSIRFYYPMVDLLKGNLSFYLWRALSILPFVGLSTAYVVVKIKFVKSRASLKM